VISVRVDSRRHHPVLAVVTLGWLEAAEQVLTTGSTAEDLQALTEHCRLPGQPPGPNPTAPDLTLKRRVPVALGCFMVAPG
jgi:hypothetical protein